MLLTILNLTENGISFYHRPTSTSDVLTETLAPSSRNTVVNVKKRAQVSLSLTDLNPSSKSASEQWLLKPESFLVQMSLALGAFWRVVPVSSSCPWRLYLSRVTKKNHRLFIFPKRNLSSFLSEMPDTLPLSSLCLPEWLCTAGLFPNVNSRFVQFLLNNLAGDDNQAAVHERDLAEKVVVEDPRIRGWALMDFYDEPEAALTPLLVECNFRGRKEVKRGGEPAVLVF